MNVTISGTY